MIDKVLEGAVKAAKNKASQAWHWKSNVAYMQRGEENMDGKLCVSKARSKKQADPKAKPALLSRVQVNGFCPSPGECNAPMNFQTLLDSYVARRRAVDSARSKMAAAAAAVRRARAHASPTQAGIRRARAALPPTRHPRARARVLVRTGSQPKTTPSAARTAWR